MGVIILEIDARLLVEVGVAVRAFWEVVLEVSRREVIMK